DPHQRHHRVARALQPVHADPGRGGQLEEGRVVRPAHQPLRLPDAAHLRLFRGLPLLARTTASFATGGRLRPPPFSFGRLAPTAGRGSSRLQACPPSCPPPPPRRAKRSRGSCAAPRASWSSPAPAAPSPRGSPSIATTTATGRPARP